MRLDQKTYTYLINGYNDDDDYHKEKIINKKAKGINKCLKTIQMVNLMTKSY